MSRKRDLILSTVLIRQGKKLVHRKQSDGEFYKNFIENLEEGQPVEMFLDASKDDGTLAQIAKLKVCIRALAKETGHSFEEMQIHVKRQSGLCIVLDIEGEKYIDCKSFGDCSKEDLALAIETIIIIGEKVNLNFR